MIVLNKIKQYLLYLYIFYVIYTPIFGSSILFDKYTILYVLLFVVLFPYLIRRDRSVLDILAKKNVIYLMSFIFLSSLYFTVVQLTNNVEIDSFTDLRIIQNNIINVLIIHAAVIIDKLRKYGFTKQRSFELLLKIGALQGLICLAGLFIPSFKELAVFFYEIAGGTNSFVIDSRIYGISNDYTFGTPIYHGLLAGLAVYEAIKNGVRRYYLYIPFILIAVMLNGRTGIVIFLVASVLSILYLYLRKGKINKILLTLGIGTLVLFSMFNALQQLSPTTYQFVNSFIEDTHNLIAKGELTGNYQVLSNELKFPEGSGILFGEGYRVYDAKAEERAGFRSDIGYVNDIYMGGVVFLAIFYTSIVYFLMHNSKDGKFIYIVIILVILLSNFKGEIFRSSIFMFLIIYYKLLSQAPRQEKL